MAFLLGCSKSSVQPAGGPSVKTAVFIGDSIAYGYGASIQANRWTTLLCVALNWSEQNAAVLGEALQNGESCSGHPVFDQSTIPTKTTTNSALFIALGMNDVGINNGTMTPGSFQSTLSSVCDFAVNTKGWKYSQIVLVTPTFAKNYYYFGSCGTVWDDARLQAYVNAVLAVATAKGCVSGNVYDVMSKSASPGSLLTDDGIHPNDSGYQLIAQYLSGLKFGS